MTTTMATETHTLIRRMVTLRAVHGDAAAHSHARVAGVKVAALSRDFVKRAAVTYRIATDDQGREWLARRTHQKGAQYVLCVEVAVLASYPTI